ncbi:MAG: hypothetical protein LBT46_01050, partial [Planctomycetaceae bacterium]|nr:hypothetical protein [Planctomycetaceae bacterium]
MLYLRCVLNHYVPDNSPVLFGFCIQVDIRRPAECGLVGSVSAIGSRFAAEEYGSLAIVDPHLKREGFDDKPGVLDVKMNTKSGEVTDAEIQVENVPQM